MKTLRNLALVLGASASFLVLGGCAVAVRPAAVVVAPAPGVVVVDPAVDWWYDGANYYYFDGASGLYFYYGPTGNIFWCARGWYPHREWLRVGHPVYHPVWRGGHPVRGEFHGGGFHGGHRR